MTKAMIIRLDRIRKISNSKASFKTFLVEQMNIADEETFQSALKYVFQSR